MNMRMPKITRLLHPGILFCLYCPFLFCIASPAAWKYIPFAPAAFVISFIPHASPVHPLIISTVSVAIIIGLSRLATSKSNANIFAYFIALSISLPSAFYFWLGSIWSGVK
jgi:hypothetical protein